MGKSKRKKINNIVTPTVTNAFGLDAAAPSPYRSFNTFPTLDRRDLSTWARRTMIERARSLVYNSSEVRAAVKTLGMLVGTLKPLPKTKDAEWNKLALKAFEKRTGNPRVFNNTGALSFSQMQSYVEEQTIVDGDVLIVLTRTPDGGGGIAIYPADQIVSKDYADGVFTTPGGRPTAYSIKGKTGEFIVSAENAILYRHSPDPTDPRGITDLVAAITTAQDVYELNGYNKAAVKLAASFGIIETVDKDVKRQDINDLRMLRNADAHQGTAPAVVDTQAPVRINGVNAITMTPGHDLKTIHDTRPSNETRNFVRDLVDSIAYGVGLDPEILYRVKEMGSASVRFSIAKAKDWARPRIADKEILCDRIWQHVISCEIAAGRLRPCRDSESAYEVDWIGNNHWSIDKGRDANASIALVREGMMSKEQYCLENYGMTYEEVLADNARSAKQLIDIATELGVPLTIIEPGQVGSTTIKEDVNVKTDNEVDDRETV